MIRITGPLRIALTVDTSITGIKRKQVIRKDLLKNQLVPNELPSDNAAVSPVFSHHPEQQTIAD